MTTGSMAPIQASSQSTNLQISRWSGSSTARDSDHDVCVIVLIAQKPPFDPYMCTAALAEHLKRWGISTVMGDNWAGGFPVSAFAKNGITYQACPLSASELYLHSLPAWTSGTVAMLDNPRAIDELTSLRRKVGQAGKGHVIHMRGHRDDLANTIAGVRLTPMQSVVCSWGGIGVVSRPRDYHGLYPGEADENMAAWLRTRGQATVNRASLDGIHGSAIAPVRGTLASNRNALW